MELTTLVLGETGPTGRRIVRALRAGGVPVRTGGGTDRPSWRTALTGVGAVVVSYDAGLSPEAVRILAETAMHAGVWRLVLLSARDDSGAVAAEKALQAFGADWTVLRLDRSLDRSLDRGLGADDVAEVTVQVLTDDKHIHQTYELTGPRLLDVERMLGRPSSNRQP